MAPDTGKEKKIFISAGEQSGELHAYSLIKEIKSLSKDSDISFAGLGGDLMHSSGTELLYHTSKLSTIGFVDVIKKYSFFKKVLRDCIHYIKKNDPDIVVLIDYPGFNLRFAEELRKFYNKKIIYYISPQLWAWHKKRVYKIKKYIDRILVVFPFEVDFYKKYGVNVTFVGHPLVTRIKEFLDSNPKVKKIFGSEKVITFLPGSRKAEINNHMPVLIETAEKLSKEFDSKVFFSIAPGMELTVFEKFKPQLKKFILTDENIYKLVLNSDLVITKSGTSTVECALIGTPFMIFYKTFPVNYYLLKPAIKIDRLGMINILSKEMVVKEFIQKDFNTANLLLEAHRILTDENYRKMITDKLNKTWDVLGYENASANAAKIILEEMQ